jgi:hypothetical protein
MNPLKTNLVSLTSSTSILAVVPTGKEEYGIRITNRTSVIYNFKPILLEIKTEEQAYPLFYEKGYIRFELSGNSLICSSEIVTDHGSEFQFEDIYTVLDVHSSFTCRRSVKIINADERDVGFATQFVLVDEEPMQMEDYHFFAPGVWYGNNENVISGAFASDYNDEHFYFRATRLALPLIMMQDKRSKMYTAICHYGPEPNTEINEQTNEWLVDESFQYASMGIKKSPSPSLRYLYPGSEGEKNYIGPNHVDKNDGWARRSHPVKQGVSHEYSLVIKSGAAENFASAMREVWRYFCDLYNPQIVQSNTRSVYNIGVELLDTYCQEYNGAMGLPFWTNVPEGQVADITFQIGFVGQQLQVAYHLLKYGLEHDDADKIRKGEGILAFWTTRSMTPSGIPQVWYNVYPPEFKDHPFYIRMMADGMEGAFNAWKVMERHGRSRPEWFEFCKTFGEWLIANQNEDGSFYRSYDINGKPSHTGTFNTTNSVRFLVQLYWETQDKRYLDTAVSAGEYAYRHTFQTAIYVGGTADNDNTIDKEAGILALYAFMALYDADGNSKWLKAAIGAADFCETWVFMWKYPVKSFKGNGVFDRADITGMSLIATGHSHADVFMSYCSFDFYRLYLLTDDPHYLCVAKLLLHNTKQTTDWSGTLGHIYPGLVEESGMFAMQYHVGLGKWLPWCTIAEIEPLTRFEEWFGSMDLDEIEKQNPTEIKAKNQGSSHLF